jgi:hypothetical protein
LAIKSNSQFFSTSFLRCFEKRGALKGFRAFVLLQTMGGCARGRRRLAGCTMNWNTIIACERSTFAAPFVWLVSFSSYAKSFPN